MPDSPGKPRAPLKSLNVRTRYGLVSRKGIARVRRHLDMAKLYDASDLVMEIAGSADPLRADIRELRGMLEDFIHGAYVEHSGRAPDEIAEDLASRFFDYYRRAEAAYDILDKLASTLCPDPDEDPDQAADDDPLAGDDDVEDEDEDEEDDEEADDL